MIKKIRTSLKISQRELSKRTGISQGYLSKLESNNSNISPTIRYICKIANALKVNPHQLTNYYIDKEMEESKWNK